MLLFGIHAVFVDDNMKPELLRNINGIGLFSKLALERGIQVYVIGEKEKIRPKSELTEFSIEESSEQVYRNFASSGINVVRRVRRNEQLTYDPRIIMITEDGVYGK